MAALLTVRVEADVAITERSGMIDQFGEWRSAMTRAVEGRLTPDEGQLLGSHGPEVGQQIHGRAVVHLAIGERGLVQALLTAEATAVGHIQEYLSNTVLEPGEEPVVVVESHR